MPDEILCQIHDLVISTQFDNCFPQLDLGNLVGADLLHICRRTVESRIYNKSDLRVSISKCLLDLNFSFHEQVLEKHTGYTLDILLVDQNGKQLALDLADSTRCVMLPNGSWQPNGPTLLKQRLLAYAGLRIVYLPFWEWNCCRLLSEKQSYLGNLISF